MTTKTTKTKIPLTRKPKVLTPEQKEIQTQIDIGKEKLREINKKITEEKKVLRLCIKSTGGLITDYVMKELKSGNKIIIDMMTSISTGLTPEENQTTEDFQKIKDGLKLFIKTYSKK